jgi:uncharacterized protein YukE
MPDIASSEIRVPTDLEGAGRFINARVAEMTAELHRLIGLLGPLQATWTGQAFTYFNGLQQSWNLAADGLFGEEGVLSIIANAMDVTWHNYSNAEWANVQTWRH